ncbi:MAG: fimbria major subunit [Muribaculaceae bacterium]
MNKIFILLCGAAATTMMFSCSSDEPNVNPGAGEEANGVAYLAVNISDATQSRTLVDNIEDGDNGDYIYGDGNEHNVSKANFYFYDDKGIFVTEASVWTGGTTGTTENIEYIGDNVLVLRNIKDNNYPTYLVTVLNAPTDFKASPRLEDMAKQQLNSYLAGANFIMSTTSFANTKGSDNYEAAGHNYYFANKLKASDFSKEPITDANASTVNKVDIYVERLAAKYTMSGLRPDGKYPVDVTIAGNDNDNVGGTTPGTGVGATKLWVKFDGWAVNATEPTSFLSKNLDLHKDGGKIGEWDWNHPDYFRSFWGESVQYGKTPVLNYTTWANAAKKDVTKALYSLECTNTPEFITSNGKLINKNVTHVVFAATVYADENCTQAPDLVLYNGVYFHKDQYIKYVLNYLQKAGDLEYYVKTDETKVPVEGYTPTVVNNYVQICPDQVKLVKASNATGDVKIISNLAEGTQLYTLEGETFVEVGVESLNNALANFNASNKATAYTGGKMVYYVPVEHLLKRSGSDAAIVEGNYGVVRNHWYNINVTKVFRLGEGVFEPGDGTDEDPGEPLIPEDPNGDTFGLGARVNILSWKIVNQPVEL